MVFAYTLILFLVLICIFYLYLTRNFNYWSERGVQFLKPTVLFGNIKDVLLWRTTLGEFCKSVYESTKNPFIGIFILDQPCLMITDLELIRSILIKDFDHFRDRTFTDNEKDDAIGSNMLLLVKSPKWTKLRKKMTPVFSSSKIRLMSKLMLVSASNMADYLREQINRERSVEVKDLFMRFTIDSITSTAFGLEGECFKRDDSPFRQIATKIYNWKRIWHAIQVSCYFLAPKLVPLFKMKFIDEKAGNFFREVFWKALRERERNKILRNDLLDIIIEMKKADEINNSETLEGDVLVAQAAQFFFAGFETSSTTLTFLILELARHSEIQDKVREDIIKAKSKHGGLTFEALQDMEYLESTIYETVRMYPILPFLDRRCNKRYQIPGSDLVLEKGDMMYVPIMGIQYDPEYFPDPNCFNPDRFHGDNIDQRNKLALLSFGAGPRNCIGRRYGLINMKACLAHLLSQFEVKSDGDIDKKFKFNRKGVSLQPEMDVLLRFEEIH